MMDVVDVDVHVVEELYREAATAALLRLDIIDLKNKVHLLTVENRELKSYISDTNIDTDTDTDTDTASISKWSRSKMAKDKLKYYHEMKNVVIHRDQLPDNTPWHIVKKKTDEMFDASASRLR